MKSFIPDYFTNVIDWKGQVQMRGLGYNSPY
jgi:hypothetical protein